MSPGFITFATLFIFSSICHSSSGSYNEEETRIGKDETESEETKVRDAFCHPFPSILLDKRIVEFENGSILHEGILYPRDMYQRVNNETRGCTCGLRNCLRKCCPRHEILGTGDRPNCTEVTNGTHVPDLLLETHQLATEIRNVGRLANVFSVISDKSCPSSRYMLEPERYAEDAFRVEENGTLRTVTSNVPPWRYCLDWKESFAKVAVVVCMTVDAQLDSEPNEQTVFNVGMIVSIPFLFVTFLVYAIIPELRNLYGKTLMCYVACLVMAYCFLVLTQYYSFNFTVCSTLESPWVLSFSHFLSPWYMRGSPHCPMVFKKLPFSFSTFIYYIVLQQRKTPIPQITDVE